MTKTTTNENMTPAQREVHAWYQAQMREIAAEMEALVARRIAELPVPEPAGPVFRIGSEQEFARGAWPIAASRSNPNLPA